MVRRGHDNCVHCFVVEQPPEIAILGGIPADQLGGRPEARAISFGHSNDLRIRLRLKIPGVNSPDQPKANDAYADPLVGAEDPAPRSRREGCRGQARLDEPPPAHTPLLSRFLLLSNRVHSINLMFLNPNWVCALASVKWFAGRMRSPRA